MSTKLYRITRATLYYENGQKDIIQSSIYTNNIEHERTRIINEYGCKKVHMRIVENHGECIKV